MSKTGKGLVEYAKSLVGTPYFYGCKLQELTENFANLMHNMYPKVVTNVYILKAKTKKMFGKRCCDCSAIIGGYRGKQIGSSQLYQQAYTRLSVDDYKKWADGVECWRNGHCGTFFKLDGKYYVVEAKGIDYGTVISEFNPKKWEKGLTFKDIEYSYDENVAGNATWRGINPYVEPIRHISKGLTGDDVKWVQWELCEAGFQKEIMAHGGIDGVAGKTFDKCVRAFQKSCKIKVDGIVGKDTRKYLKAN